MNDSIVSRAARVALILVALVALWKFAGLYAWIFVATYLFYVAIFSIKKARARSASTLEWHILTGAGYLLLIPGLVLDWLLNVLSSVVFWDFPDRLGELFTNRLKRYLKFEPRSSFRYRAAHAICKYLLHPWDENHCFEDLR